MVSHAGFLRELWPVTNPDFVLFLRAFYQASRRADHQISEEAITSLFSVIDRSNFTDKDRYLLRYSIRLTKYSSSMCSSEVDSLRQVGFSDREIHDIVMVNACFAFMNRLADGTGVSLTEARHDLAIDLFGQERLAEHLAWG